VITSNDPVHPSVAVVLTGYGVPGKLQMPRRLGFPEIASGTSSIKNLAIKNSGLGVLHGSVETITGPFTVMEGSGAFALVHGQTALVNLEFSPTTAGETSGTLKLDSDDPAHSSISVALTGSAR
jgi:hypothetical protein